LQGVNSATLEVKKVFFVGVEVKKVDIADYCVKFHATKNMIVSLGPRCSV
jgi:hypothetical protein